MNASNSLAWSLDPHIRLVAGGIPAADAVRQTSTAAAILEHLASRPGVVLADEVGMGKTFVALAVAASAAFQSDQPAVVMVPMRLLDKWERDVNRFRSLCLGPNADGGAAPDLRCRRAESGAAFLACFDDPPDRRAHLVLLVNTALHRSERDPFVRLEALRQAVQRGGGGPNAHWMLARRAHELLRSGSLRELEEEHIAGLLKVPAGKWCALLNSFGVPCADDPVPEAFLEALAAADLRQLSAALDEVPKFASKHYDERLATARVALNASLRGVWSKALEVARIHSPLLIFDEAHHLKNPDTRLASLFLDPECGDTSVITGAFDRMLFLTATPFQLGHGELLEVLRRFLAARFETLGGKTGLERVRVELGKLASALDHAQGEAVHLDRLWSELRREDLPTTPVDTTELEPGSSSRNVSKIGFGVRTASASDVASTPSSEDAWWEMAMVLRNRGGSLSPRLATVLDQYERTRSAMAQSQVMLRPWVIRHLRPRVMSTGSTAIPRRIELTGRAIVDDQDHAGGLVIPSDARFPFLLCARAQSIVARARGTRAYFAEGLASSYAAFLDTSKGARPVDDENLQQDDGGSSGEVDWYLSSVDDCVRASTAPHPKIEAIATRALALWREGHKVLIFGHYLKTIRALNERLDLGVEQAVGEMAVEALKLESRDPAEALDHVRRIALRLQDQDSPLRRSVRDALQRWMKEAPQLTEGQREQVITLLLGTLATPSFIVRNFPLHRPEVRASLETERPTAAQARGAADAVADSLARGARTRLSFKVRVEAFLAYLTDVLSTAAERDAALRDMISSDRRVVRHATGEVEADTRRRLLLGFNSPLLPEILVASEVMAEGVDLHLDCRHVIHHDLSWNPSTLEQRTGRVDRLRCLAEQEGESILVYLPYLEGTADEKMYRVVSDRARWFQVVMGEQYEVDEHATDALAARVPFPASAAAALALQLSVT